MIGAADSSGLFTASEVEARVGVPATTLRQWERRYGLPSPQRNASGYRLYSRKDLVLIDFIRQRIEEGVAASRAAELARAQLVSPPVKEAEGSVIGDTDTSISNAATSPKALADLLIQADLLGAERLLAEAFTRFGIEGVLMQVVQPTLALIGERWERGEITIAHEHQASAFLRSQVANLLSAAGHSRFGPLVVAACGPQEQHEIGLLMLSVVLRRMGVQVQYLGANTPLADLGMYARSVGAQAILLSINTPQALQAALNQRGDLCAQDQVGQEPLVFVGGQIINADPAAAAQLGQWAGGDALQAASQIVSALTEQSKVSL